LLTAGLVACLVIAIDRWTKRQIETGLGPGSAADRIDLIGDWFALEYAQNRGAAFGLLGSIPGAVTAAAVLILVVVVAYAASRHAGSPWLWLGVGLVGGGAVGNLIDRLRLGYVIDFVAVGRWPNFNVADAAISVGVACLAIDVLASPSASEPVRRGGKRRRTSDDRGPVHD